MRRFFEYLQETVWKSRLKTCFCVAPVHIGLLILAYIHILIAILQMTSLSTGTALLWPVSAHVSSDVNGGESEGEPPSSLCVLHPAVELFFTGVLLAGLHRRDVVLLRVYLWYGVAIFFLGFLMYGLVVAVIKPLYCVLIALNAIYQLYVLLLVRSLKIEIELIAKDENKYMYNKDHGVVIVRDVESPMPRPIILDGYRVLPALPAPEMTTSITTLNDQRPESPLDSKYNTLNKSSTLRTGTLQSYRISPDTVDNTQRSATLPHQDTAIIHKQSNTQAFGAVQSLAGPSNFKPLHSNTDTLKREFINPSTSFATVSKGAVDNIIKTKPADLKETDDNTKSDTATDNESKDKHSDEPKKKKQGFFKKTPKEKDSKKDNDDKPVQSNCDASTSKSGESDSTNINSKQNSSSKGEPSIAPIDEKDNVKPADLETGDKKEEPIKKKRGIFRKQPKELKNEKKEDK